MVPREGLHLEGFQGSLQSWDTDNIFFAVGVGVSRKKILQESIVLLFLVSNSQHLSKARLACPSKWVF